MKALRAGSAVLVAAAAGVLAASFAMLSPAPSLHARAGRHLWGGALANASAAVLLILIAAIPLRRGEKWAFWAFVIPIVLYGLPVAVLDTLYAPRDRLFSTLAPQFAGLAAVAVGLSLCAMEIWKK